MRASYYFWQCAVILISAGCGAAAYVRVAKNRKTVFWRKSARSLYFAAALLLLPPFLNIYLTGHPDLHWRLPTWLQLHYIAISWAALSGSLAYAFAFCCAPAFLASARLRWLPPLFGLFVLIAIQGYARWSTRPNLPYLAHGLRSGDGVILQSCRSTCVPASAANIAAILGVRATEKELADLCQTTADGTYPAYALAGLAELGISGRKATTEEIRKLKTPAMLFVLGDIHAIVYVGMTNGLVEVWDPGMGRRFITEKKLRGIWAGHALEFWREK